MMIDAADNAPTSLATAYVNHLLPYSSETVQYKMKSPVRKIYGNTFGASVFGLCQAPPMTWAFKFAPAGQWIANLDCPGQGTPGCHHAPCAKQTSRCNHMARCWVHWPTLQHITVETRTVHMMGCNAPWQRAGPKTRLRNATRNIARIRSGLMGKKGTAGLTLHEMVDVMN